MWSRLAAILLVLLPQVVYGGPYSNPNCASGRDTIVHLFEWKWTDIKAECERFLGPYGYCGVQISPPHENAVITTPNRPWWERYQPVSYTIMSRSGNEQEFRDMVAACNKAGVRIYADTVLNHMTGDIVGVGTAGSHFDGGKCTYPAVPFVSQDCNGADNCNSTDGSIHNFDDRNEVRNCELFSLADLRLSSDHVRGILANYLNYMIDIGVAGFRIDAAKHMWPGDLTKIFSRLKDLRTDVYGPGKKAFIFQEIIDLGNDAVKMAEYYPTGKVTNFLYGIKLADVFLRHTDKANTLPGLGSGLGMPDSNDALVFLNNHDNQRGHGTGGDPITFWYPKVLRVGTAFMLAFPYGFARVMSSYRWTKTIDGGDDINNWEGPPHNADMSTQDVPINADMSCGGGWVCEHRWPQIYNMVAFRNVVTGTTLTNFQSYGDFQISFSRGNKGFIAIVGDDSSLNRNINTGLPSGDYCDVISGDYLNGACTGKTIHVDGSGQAHININGHTDNPVVAIHIGAKVGEAKHVIIVG